MKPKAPRAATLGLAALLLAVSLPAVAGAASEIDVKELQQLNDASFDPARAEHVITRARELLRQDLDPGYQLYLRQLVLRSQVRRAAPLAEVVAAADSLRPFLGEDPRSQVQFHTQMARAMLERGDGADQARRYAQEALDACPDDPTWIYARADCLMLLGAAETQRGRTKEAIAHLLEALPAAPDSHAVRVALGRAYERDGNADQAIDHYVRALGTFPCKDTTAKATLTALYARRHRGTDGLEERIEAACRASRRHVALDARRHEMTAPDWTLADFDSNLVRFSDLKGKVVVIDFWGSWCGPCRAELPYFQAMYERYRDQGVAFIGIAWEQVRTREEAVRASKRFMDQNNLNFPVVVDHARQAVDAFGIDSFPTVFMIDKTGRVRYRNVGFSEDIDHVMEAQIESLLE